MTISPALALRKALVAHLRAQAPLVTALGGQKIFDEAPRGAAAPYVLLGDAQMRDWSSAGSRGVEHLLTLGVVSSAHGVREALDLAQMLIDTLDEASLSLQGHTLVDLRFVAQETRRSDDGRFARASLRFRALTEYL